MAKFIHGTFVRNIIVLLTALALCFISLEFILRLSVYYGEMPSNPAWIPYKFSRANDEINLINAKKASQNSFGFNDRERSVVKEPGIFRIAVLGDSFVWGDGVPYDVIWSHKLEKMVQEKAQSVEVLSWGKNGWSTKDELNFLKQHGINFDIDYLIVDYVSNDPDVGLIPQKILRWQNSSVIKPIGTLFPNAVSFISSHINALLRTYLLKDYGYARWESALYSDANLDKYGELLKEFSGFMRENGIDVIFVLTPNSPDEYFEGLYDKITVLLDDAGIQYLNLYPAMEKEFGGYNRRDLWANPANGHPGDIVTDVYAREVFNYLVANSVF